MKIVFVILEAKRAMLIALLALVAGGVFGQTNNRTYNYTWAEYQGREEKWSGIIPRGASYTEDSTGGIVIVNSEDSAGGIVVHSNVGLISDGIYKYYDCYIVGSFSLDGGNLDDRTGGDPAVNGPLFYNTNPKRRFADFSNGAITCVQRTIGKNARYAVTQVQTGADQIVAIMTSRETHWYSWSEKVRLLLIQPNSRVEFTEEGLILHSGRITEDINIAKASSLDEVLSTYSQVMDHPNLYGMNLAYADAKMNWGDDPNAIASHIIAWYATGQFGYSLASGIVMPIWMLPAEFANAFGSNLLKASLAYAVSMAYGTKPVSSDEFKYDLYILLAGEDVQALLKSAAKAAGVSIGTELLSKEFVLEAIANGLSGTQTATRNKSTELFLDAVMKTDAPKKVASKLSLKGIAKAVPIISAAIFSVKDAIDVFIFGNEAKLYYSNKAAEGEEDLPENVDVVFQTASVLGVSKDGFFVPANSNPQNNTGIQLGNIGSDNSPHRIFQLQHVGEGWYRIKNNKFGVLTVPESKNENDVQMVLSPQGNNNPTNQQFKITKVGTGLYKIWTYYGRLIRVREGLVRRNHIVTWAQSRFGSGSQTWRIYTVDAGKLTQLGGIDRNHDLTPPTPGPGPAPAPTPPPPPPTSSNWIAVRDSTFGGSRINAVAWGNNTWVAVGGDGKIAYSSNGTSWTATSMLDERNRVITTNLLDVAFGNDMFIAVGSSKMMASSPDGKTWTAVENAPSGNWNGIVFGGGRWVVVGGLSNTAYSTNDGANWTNVSAAGIFKNQGIVSVAFGNNSFIAGGAGGRMATSSNGASWTAVAKSPFGTSSTVQGIVYADNRWVAVANGGGVAFSPDGAAWTVASLRGGPNPFGIGFGNNRYVVVGSSSSILYSADGATWLAVEKTPFDAGNEVAYGNGRFVAVGNNGRMAYCDWGEQSVVTPPAPTGPTNWTAVSDTPFGSAGNSSSQINSIAFGNNTWVAVGGRGNIAYSSDGRSWTAIPRGTDEGQSTFQDDIYDVAFGNNMFVAVGDRGSIASSSDGKTWRAVTNKPFGDYQEIHAIAFGGGWWVIIGSSNGNTAYSPDGRNWKVVTAPITCDDIAYGNNRFVGVGDGGQIVYSSNGASWTVVNASSAFIGQVPCIGFGNNRFVVGGQGSIAYSSEGATWTAVPRANIGGFSSVISDVAFGKDRFVAVDPQGRIAFSADGASWTAVPNTTFNTTGNVTSINAIAYGNGRFVAVGNNGKMAYCDW